MFIDRFAVWEKRTGDRAEFDTRDFAARDWMISFVKSYIITARADKGCGTSREKARVTDSPSSFSSSKERKWPCASAVCAVSRTKGGKKEGGRETTGFRSKTTKNDLAGPALCAIIYVLFFYTRRGRDTLLNNIQVFLIELFVATWIFSFLYFPY